MHPDLLEPYVRDVYYQSEYSALASDLFNESVERYRVTGEFDLPRMYWAAQTILTCGAQISKLLQVMPRSGWSKEKKAVAAARATCLQELLQPDPILFSRTVRNSVEHYDERLDDEAVSDFAQVTTGSGPLTFKSTIDRGIAQRSQIALPNPRYLRNIDPEGWIYTALDEDISLVELILAINAVAARAFAWLEAHEPPEPTGEELAELAPVIQSIQLFRS